MNTTLLGDAISCSRFVSFLVGVTGDWIDFEPGEGVVGLNPTNRGWALTLICFGEMMMVFGCADLAMHFDTSV